MECWSCHEPAARGLVCEACGAPQPPRGTDAFAHLGVPRRFDLSPSHLEARHRELSRQLHPDRFAKADPRVRRASLLASTALNDAYRKLKTPLGRAEHLLELHGMPVGEKDTIGSEFLVEMMELREGLAEAKAGGDETRLRALGNDVRGRRDAAMARVAELLSAAAPEVAAVKEQILTMRYFQRFLTELEAGSDE